MKKLIIILMLVMINKVNAQSPVISYDNCFVDKFCLDCGDSKASYEGKKSLSEYFRSKISRQNLQGIKGNLYFQVIVDESGKVCCKSISNATNATIEQVRQLHLDRVIANMEEWRPAKTNGKAEVSSVTLIITIKNFGELAVDYLRLGEIKLE